MSKYRKVDPRIWNDAKFNSLSDDAKLVFLFVLTHPHMTALGAMRGTIPGLASELGWTVQRFEKGFMEPFEKGMLDHDEKACFVWLPNFLKYNPPDNPNVVKSWHSSLELLPECHMKYELIRFVVTFVKGLPKGFAEGLPEPFTKGMPIQEQEQEQDKEEKLLSFEPKKTVSNDPCPHQEIIDLYHSVLPELPSVKIWNEARKALLRQRWKEAPQRQNLGWWESYFRGVKQSDFLCGRSGTFCASLEWLLKPKNMPKVIEGNYVTKSRNNNGTPDHPEYQPCPYRDISQDIDPDEARAYEEKFNTWS